MELETLKVCIDGVDCSGKTTLWNTLHKISDYRWKLEDRSFVTMTVYARHHGRAKKTDYHRQLIADLSNLNHKYILLHPSWDVIEQRFNERGDDLHSLDALKAIHKIYGDIVNEVRGFPNVLVLDGVDTPQQMASNAHEWILSQDRTDLDGLVSIIQKRCDAAPCREVSPLRFSFVEDGTFPQLPGEILNPDWVSEHFPHVKPATVHEFQEMVRTFEVTLDDELAGRNIYNRPEGPGSRRWVFTQQACVSFIQVMLRDNMLKFYVTCRSSHVHNVFPADIRLMYYMAHLAAQKLKPWVNDKTRIYFDFTLNSAHSVA